tara:strand:+ start:1291 stop:1842 length:552 start_codon:yes stop_codon:yes gene_type:complete
VFIHKTAVLDDNITLGNNISIWHFCHIMSGSRIGDNSSLGQNVMIGRNVRIGKGCKIQNNVSVYEGVELSDNVFCGPSCVFTNVINPRSFVNRKKEFKKTLVKEGASIGANATIICGVTIGSFSLIGAGSVITKDVKSYAIMAGNPAKKIGWVSTKGYKLDENLRCPETGEEFYLDDEILRKK